MQLGVVPFKKLRIWYEFEARQLYKEMASFEEWSECVAAMSLPFAWLCERAAAMQGNSACPHNTQPSQMFHPLVLEISVRPKSQSFFTTTLSQVFGAPKAWDALRWHCKVPVAKKYVSEQLHLFRKMKSTIACGQVCRNILVLNAERNQNEVAELQKRDRSLMCVTSSVICRPLVIYTK